MSGSALARAAEAARIQRTFKALEAARRDKPLPALQPPIAPVVPLNDAALADALRFAAGMATVGTLGEVQS